MKKKTVKEYSLEQEAKRLQEKLNAAAEKEQKEVADYISNYLKSKGYALSARVIIEPNQSLKVEPFIYKANQ